jgi:hypothetical protein
VSEERVRIEIDAKLPLGVTLEEMCKLVMLQMHAPPCWPEGEEGGTGHLNYVCFDRTMRITGSKIL